MSTRYVRFAALGDSTTFGIGDPVPGGWRGWARLLSQAMGATYDVSLCNLAVSGATAADVLHRQLTDAVAHRADLASLVVGVNDTMRSTWDDAAIRDQLLTCAEALHDSGALLMTARFHDHGAILGLPAPLRRPLTRRIGVLNAAYDEIHGRWGGVRLDLAASPHVSDRGCWSVDRMHPSERGHRVLAAQFAGLLSEHGIPVEPPSLEPAGGLPASWRRDLGWLVTEGGPWMGRRARDLGPWAVRQLVAG